MNGNMDLRRVCGRRCSRPFGRFLEIVLQRLQLSFEKMPDVCEQQKKSDVRVQ